ncbi:helix-turn-helix domain-containing protein [Streptomyces sp. NPDC004647]|uniref:helix-turn-helix domain-containing protein n=1 Tax=Streptomyces sp. NPDC004647 TaxID=3154671 RepID=UPI0033B0A3AF
MPIVGQATQSERLELGLLGQIRRQATDPNLPRLIAWLAEAVDGHVTLTGATGELLAQSSDAASRALAPAARQMSRVAAGELMSAGLDDGALKARLLAIGNQAPHAVLAVARTKPYPASATEMVSHVADLLALLLPTTELEASRHGVRQTVIRLQQSIFQLLMCGQTPAARRSAASLAPGVLADAVRVYIVECRTGHRDRTAEAIETAIKDVAPATKTQPGGPTPPVQGALVVHCPAYDNHLVVVAPARDHPPAPHSVDPVGARLQAVIADRAGHYLGASETTALDHTADGYRDAFRALSVAQHMPERAWQYNGHAELAAVLEDHAYSWAEAFLQPLISAPCSEGVEVFSTLRVALAFPIAEAARILDVHRNTVARRLKGSAELLQLDLGDIRARAVLDLALQIDAKAAGIDPRPSLTGPVRLEDVLSAPAARAWAEMTLAPLGQDRRDLRRSLRVWLAHNTNADQAGAELDVHPQTIRGHLRSAERLLQRSLLAGASGAHDIVIALFIASDIPTLPGQVPPLSPGLLERLRNTGVGIDTLPEGWVNDTEEE